MRVQCCVKPTCFDLCNNLLRWFMAVSNLCLHSRLWWTRFYMQIVMPSITTMSIWNIKLTLFLSFYFYHVLFPCGKFSALQWILNEGQQKPIRAVHLHVQRVGFKCISYMLQTKKIYIFAIFSNFGWSTENKTVVIKYTSAESNLDSAELSLRSPGTVLPLGWESQLSRTTDGPEFRPWQAPEWK